MMNQIQTTLLELVSGAISGAPPAGAVPDEVLQEAYEQTVSGMIQPGFEFLDDNVRVNIAHADLTEALAGIGFVTIKGYASASYYPIPEKRTMGDVDFYVAPEDYEKAEDRLLSRGYRLLGKRHVRHKTLVKDDIVFELHSEIKGIPNGKDGIRTTTPGMEQVVRRYLSDVIATAVRTKTQYGTIVCPDAFHHGLIMLLHLAAHIVNDGGVGLRHLCDWAVYADKVDVSAYESQLREMGLWTFACLLTATCSRYLGLRAMPWTGEHDARLLEEILDDVMQSGNFSNKASGRWFASTVQRGNVFATAAEMAKKRYKFCRTHPWLLPYGIALYACFYLKERLTGRRKWMSLSTLADGKQRVELFDAFRLFEREEES